MRAWLSWYARGVPLAGRLIWEVLGKDGGPLPSRQLATEIAEFRATRPAPFR